MAIEQYHVLGIGSNATHNKPKSVHLKGVDETTNSVHAELRI